MPPSRLSPLDLTLVAAYLVGITLFGLRFAKKSKQSGSLKSYFLADNTIPWWAIALSIVSAETSTLTIVSIPGVAFAGDMGFLQIVLGYMLGRIVVALLFLPKYFRGEMLTAYQLIDRRFGHILHKVTAGLFLLTRAAAEGVRIFAISIVVSIAIGTGDTLSIAIISALTLLYTFEGGMAAVIWTDVVQMALYVAGTLVALYTLSAHTGGWSHIHSTAAPLGKFHMLNFAVNLTQSYTFWAGILGGTFLTMASHGTDQLMVQRMLAARNLRESRLALLSSGVVIFLQFTLFLLIGIGLFVFYAPHPQHFKTNDYIFPTFIVQQMPHGVAGLLIAAILAAAMSNLSAALNSLASTTVIDFYVPLRARLNRKKPVILSEQSKSKDPDAARQTTESRTFQTTNLVSRISTVVWALILFAIAVYSIQAGGKGHVVETGLSIASVAYGCLLGVFLLGTLTRFATQTGATLGMICGFALNVFLYQATFPHPIYPMPIRIAFTWYVLIGALATFATGSLFSLILPKPCKAATLALVFCFFGLSFRSEAQESAVALSFSTSENSVILSGGSRGIMREPQSKDPDDLRPTSTARTFQPEKPDFSPISTLLNTAIAKHQLPGAVVLIGHNNKIVFEQAYGNRALEPVVEPMTTDTIFDMASLTKVLVTTTAILQLYEQHKLDLDAPVAKYLPEFASTTGHPNPTTGDKDGAVIPVASGRNLRSSPSSSFPPSTALSSFAAGGGPASPPAPNLKQATTYKSQITIRQLLTHYSGLPEDVNLKDDWGFIIPGAKDWQLKGTDKAEGIRRAMAAVPYGPAGLTFKYSDINFIVLGALVEQISGLRLDDYAEKAIFRAPFWLRDTHYYEPYLTCTDSRPAPYGYRPPPLPAGNDDASRMARNKAMKCKMTYIVRYPLNKVAPTAYDDQGTTATNPNFGQMLRGTVHDPTTRRMGGVAGHAGVFSTAEDASKFCAALLEKLLHNTGPFPLSQATLQMATIPQAPATAHADATIFTPTGETTKGVAQRGLGWDINSPYSRPRGEIFPISTREHPGSFGHTGFTGTSMWLDPVSDTYVILLSNAIHPRGAPPISTLRGQVATAAARALAATAGAPSFPGIIGKGGVSSEARPSSSTPPQTPVILSERSESKDPDAASPTSTSEGFQPVPQGLKPGFVLTSYPTAETAAITTQNASAKKSSANLLALPSRPLRSALSSSPPPQTQTGIDVLESTQFAALKTLAAAHQNHLRIAVLANQSSIDAHSRRTIDILKNADPAITLEEIFTPEHGLFAAQDTEQLHAEQDPTTHLPVISLYGPKSSDKHPKQSDLKNVDAVVIDLQDAGVRFWTYETVLGYFLEDCAHAKVEVVVLDRPNPIGGISVQGPSSDLGYESYIDFMSIPIRHGMTFGELARFFNDNATQIQIKPDLTAGSALHIGDNSDNGAGGVTDNPPATPARPARLTHRHPHAELAARRILRRHRPPLGRAQPQHEDASHEHRLPRRSPDGDDQHERRPRLPRTLRKLRSTVPQIQRTRSLPERPQNLRSRLLRHRPSPSPTRPSTIPSTARPFPPSTSPSPTAPRSTRRKWASNCSPRYTTSTRNSSSKKPRPSSSTTKPSTPSKRTKTPVT